MKTIIYHNPRCTKSRQGLAYLEDLKVDLEIVEYLKILPSKTELNSVLKKLGIKAEDLVRKTEDIYKSQYKGKNLSEEEWIAAMIEHPKLIERPIIIRGDKAVIGRPTEKIKELF